VVDNLTGNLYPLTGFLITLWDIIAVILTFVVTFEYFLMLGSSQKFSKASKMFRSRLFSTDKKFDQSQNGFLNSIMRSVPDSSSW